MSQIKITRTEKTRMDKVDFDNLGFGVYLSDHVYMSENKNGSWNEGEIKPYGPMAVEPAMCTLHYGQTIFEGMKAYMLEDGSVNLFRPDKNIDRLNISAERICIPPFPKERFLEAIKELVTLDYKWIPKNPGCTLYLRPLCYGDANFLGVHASDSYKLIIMTSPVGSYYKEGLKPIRIKVADEYVRAVRGGIGAAKTAGNYAASILAGEEAKKEGYAQVLWLDGVEQKYVDEVGAMNMMFVINGELITPTLDQGSILPGITRDSVLTLARDMGLKVIERKISMDELVEAHQNGSLEEAFGTGTAAVISPVGSLTFKDKEYVINNNTIGNLSQKFYDTLTGMQFGKVEDKFGWITNIPKP